MALTFVGGLTLEARRKNIVLPVEDASLPAVVRLKLIDGCLPTVAAGDTVAEGERVAENDDGFRILSPVCGEVTAADDGFVTVRSTRGGEPVGLPPVESPVVSLSYEDVSERLKQAGVVGAMSGVPVYRKLARAKGKAKRIVINCLESDPYSAHISRLVTDNAEEIVNGAKILMHAVCVKRSVIAIEENRTEAIRALRNAVYDKTLVSTALFKPKYPAGNELLTVNAIYGREVRSGRTPEESGYLVLSAETLLNVFNAFAYGTPQTRKVVTVSGNAVSRKKILRVRNGTSADEIFANCDGTGSDVTVYTHELGHGLQGYLSYRSQPLADYVGLSPDLAEVHSKTMELLTLPYARDFFGPHAPQFLTEHRYDFIKEL